MVKLKSSQQNPNDMCYYVNQSLLDFDEDFKVTVPKNWPKSTGDVYSTNLRNTE